MTASAEVLVIGGGPAGAAVAARLAAAGRAVILCERQAQPRPQVCGEFISASAVEELQDLGVVPTLLGAAEIRQARLFVQDRMAEAGLPFIAHGLSRTRLDASLLDLAARAGGRSAAGRGGALACPDGWRLLAGHAQRRAAHRDPDDAPGERQTRAARAPTGWEGSDGLRRVQDALAAAPEQKTALGQRIELFVRPDGYAGLQPIDAGTVNLCFVMGVTLFQTLGGSFAAALAYLRQLIPALDERLRGATPCWTAPASVAGLPYGYLCRPSDCADGVYRVGDQFAVIPSFTGEGIAIALRTARLAADAIMAGVPSEILRRPRGARCAGPCASRPCSKR